MDYVLHKEPEEEKQPKTIWMHLRCSAEPIIFFYLVALQIQNPALQQYSLLRFRQDAHLNTTGSIQHGSCMINLVINGSSSDSLQVQVQDRAGLFTTGLMLFEMIPSVIVCLFLGPLSDRIGRKPILALSLFTSVIEAGIIIATVYFDLHLYIIYIGSFINGIGGYFTSIQMCMMAIISDTTSKENRYFRLGVVNAFALTGGLVSNLVSGVLIKKYGFLLTFSVVTALFAMAFLYCCLVLKETRPRALSEKSAIGFSSLIRYPITAVRCLVNPSPRRWKILTIFVAEMFYYFAFMGAVPVLTLFALNKPFCLSSQMVGFFLATRFACIGLGLPIMLKLLRCLPDSGMAIVGLISLAASYTSLVFAETTTALFLSWLFGLATAVPESMFRSNISNNVGNDDQGKIFSLVASVEILFVFMGNATYNAIYSIGNHHHFPGLAFLFGASVLSVPLLLTLFFGIRSHLLDRRERAFRPGNDGDVDRQRTLSVNSDRVI